MHQAKRLELFPWGFHIFLQQIKHELFSSDWHNKYSYFNRFCSKESLPHRSNVTVELQSKVLNTNPEIRTFKNISTKVPKNTHSFLVRWTLVFFNFHSQSQISPKGLLTTLYFSAHFHFLIVLTKVHGMTASLVLYNQK